MKTFQVFITVINIKASTLLYETENDLNLQFLNGFNYSL